MSYIVQELRAAWNALTTDVQDALVEMGWDDNREYPVLTGADGKPKSSNPADHLRWLTEHAATATKTLAAASTQNVQNSAPVTETAPEPVAPGGEQMVSSSIHEANNATTGTAQPALDNLNEPAKA